MFKMLFFKVFYFVSKPKLKKRGKKNIVLNETKYCAITLFSPSTFYG